MRASMVLALAMTMLATGEGRAADAASPPLPSGDPAHGGKLFRQRCGGCHALSENRFGPRLGDVYGRRAGAAPDFRYSQALGSQAFQWNDASLDAWLAGPRRFVPGAAMSPHVDDAQARADLIAYLRTRPVGH